jgi:hypothetical protein
LILQLCPANAAAPQANQTELVVQTGITENPIVAFSPDGKWFVTGAKGRLVISDLSGHQLRTIQRTGAGGPGGGYISISSDGRYAIVYDPLSRQVSVWDIVSGKPADTSTLYYSTSEMRGILPQTEVINSNCTPFGWTERQGATCV